MDPELRFALELVALGISAFGVVLAVIFMRTDRPGKPKDRPNRKGW